MNVAQKTATAAVKRCVPCQDGGYLVQVSIQKPRCVVAVRSPTPVSVGSLLSVRGNGTAWSIAA